jgi:site-specific DNA-methyltransferase (adenine-specific)
MITISDSLQFLTTKQEHEFNILYADPPYALGSSVIVRPDGKVDYHKASDFMSKWEMPTGDYWEKWFKEAHRVLKNGGWLIMFGIDRQLLLFKYYALLAGFEEQQSLYWYFISNFPKATDLSKMLDKNAGVDREAIAPSQNARPKSLKEDNLYEAGTVGKEFDITAPSTDLAKKYDGYKYSISPLKQTNETIMIFKKPSKTGSVLHDTLAFENGDTTINVSALDIDGNRVKLGENEKIPRLNVPYEMKANNNFGGGDDGRLGEITLTGPNGRYPAQTFIDNQVAEILDEQSGFSKGAATVNKYGSPSGSGIYAWNNTDEKPSENIKVDGYDDIGGASKILHKCNYEQDDVTLYHYEPKVSGSERNAGLGGFEKKRVATLSGADNDGFLDDVSERFRTAPSANNHPTLKPIDLNYRILKLFKLPTDQKICYPFAGSGSEIIGGIKAGFENWVGCEINAEYVAIANARINYWKETMWEQQSLFDEVI